MNALPILLTLSILLILPPISSALSVPLTVTDYSGTVRTQDPVTSGVPLPESSGITSTSQLRVTDSLGSNIPAQFTVLAKWNGTPSDSSKPIKWVLLDFQATTPASGTSIYYLKDGPYSFTSQLSVQDQTSMITVTTGKAKFQISKNYFNLFDYVWIDKDGDGWFTDAVVSQPGQGGTVLTDENGTKYYTNLEAPENITIEESGPMRTVILIRGVFKATDGSYFAPALHNPPSYPRLYQPYPHSYVYYNARIHFYNNMDYAKVYFTLENNGAHADGAPESAFAPRQSIYFDSINLNLNLNFASATVKSEDSSALLTSPGSVFTLYQGWRENLTDIYNETIETVFDKGIFYTTSLGGSQLSSGKTNPGWLDMNDGAQGVGLAIRQFWQNFPKRLNATISQLQIALWPEGDYYPYCIAADFSGTGYDAYCRKAGRDANLFLFDGGEHKTYEMMLDFYPGASSDKTKSLSKGLEEPLMALADSRWYADSKALGLIAPYGLSSADPELNEAMLRFEKLQSANVYAADSQNGRTLESVKTQNPPYLAYNKQNRFFGWMNYGDVLWSGGTSSLHYDWTYSMLLHYIRSGRRNFFDEGVEMAKHRYDIDQYHGERTDTNNNHKWVNHMQFYEETGHSDPNIHYYHPSSVGKTTHTWNGGLVLYYLLTGDRKAMEAAEENGLADLNYFGPNGISNAENLNCGGDEIRAQGWSILNLVNLYRVDGNPQYLAVAKNIAKNILLYREQQVTGGGGYWGTQNLTATSNMLNPFPCNITNCASCSNTQWSTMFIYVLEPLVQIQYETRDEELKNLLIRVANYTKDKYLFGGDYNASGYYRALQSLYLWADEDRNGSIRNAKGEIVKDVFLPDLFAYVYNLTGNPLYLDWARRTFKDGMFYYASPVSSIYFNKNTRSTISFYDGMFAGSESKTHGWIGRTNQLYLYTEYAMGGTIPLSITTSSFPQGSISSPYSQALSAMGGTSPYTWSVITGSLPPGLSLSSAGLISGTPTSTGTYSFTVQVRDSSSTAGTSTRQLSITVSLAADNAPVRSNGQPTGTLAAGTTSATLSLTTDEAATCRYSTTAGTAYSFMTSGFSGAGSTSHSAPVSGLQNGNSYNYYVRCQDTAGNANTNDYTISFSVGAAAAGTCQANLVLLHHYDNNLFDSSGSGNAGTCTSCPAFTTGKFSGGLQFDGLDDYVDITKRSSLYLGTNDFSISFWIRTLNSTPEIIGDVNTYSSGYRGWDFRLNTAKPEIWMSDGSGTRTLITGVTSINNGNWRHVVLVFDRDANATIYVDGATDKSGSITAESGTIDQCPDITIGAGRNSVTAGCTVPVTTKPLNGSIDELAIWNRALSAAEVQALYTSSSPISCFHRSDSNPADGCISLSELTVFITRWKMNNLDVTLREIIEAIGLWKRGCPS